MKKRSCIGIFIWGIVMVGSADQPKVDLTTILKNSAEYCERLKTAVFQSICMETVNETSEDWDGPRKTNTFLYDYQIILKGGKTEETRTLMEVNGVSVPPQKNAILKTEYYSHYSVFAPVFLLARENQEKYRYRFVKEEQVKGVKAWILDIEPLEKRGIILHGRIWLDQKDFSVLCIEVNPEALGGFQKRQENARRLGAKLWMSDIHWYEVTNNGFRFPSRTEFFEKYRFEGDLPAGTRNHSLKHSDSIGRPSGWTWNRTMTFFTYSRYRFFQVQLDVKEHTPGE